MGGEIQRESVTHDMGYSASAHCIGKRSYLEPISQSMHVPIEEVYSAPEKTEDSHVLERKQLKTTMKTQHEPIWSVLVVLCTNL